MTAKTATPLDKLYFDIFVTALEGGIGYWSQCSEYHWALDRASRTLDDNEDLQGFKAVVQELDDNFGISDASPTHVIDRVVIAKGLRALAAGKVTWGGRLMEPDGRWIKAAKAWLRNPEDADIDSDAADNIVQAGLFGDIRYG